MATSIYGITVYTSGDGSHRNPVHLIRVDILQQSELSKNNARL